MPVWNPDGLELFYVNDTSLISASLNFNADIPIERNVLFDLERLDGEMPPFDGFHYDNLNEEFLFILHDPFDPIGSIDVVVNWFEELNTLVPISN